jgi:exodeoxyribonuclease VII small subunit
VKEKKKPTEPIHEQTFETALEQLEGIVGRMEAGQLPLADSLAAYEQGIGLIKYCHQLLKQSEQKVLQLSSVSEAGEPRLQPFLEKPSA